MQGLIYLHKCIKDKGFTVYAEFIFLFDVHSFLCSCWLHVISYFLWLPVISNFLWLPVISYSLWLQVIHHSLWLHVICNFLWLHVNSHSCWLSVNRHSLKDVFIAFNRLFHLNTVSKCVVLFIYFLYLFFHWPIIFYTLYP